jgi:hypothetical protein
MKAMKLHKRLLVLCLIGSIALNAMLLIMVFASASLMNGMSEQLEQSSIVLADLMRRHTSTVNEADQLRDDLQICRVDIIKRILGLTPPARIAPAPQRALQIHDS